MNIYQKLNEVRKEVEYLKRGSAGQGTGVLYDEVVALSRDSIVNHGILIVPDFIADDKRLTEGKKGYIYEGFFRISYINIDEPTDRFHTDIVAHAMDAGDKATGKAITYATKISLVKVLYLETGLNDESRSSTQATFSEDQHDMFHDILNEENPLKFYCFVKSISEDAYMSLYNSFPKEKGKNKEKCNSQMREGLETLQNVCDELDDLAGSQDPSIVENIEGLSDMEKRMIGKHIKKETIEFLKTAQT